MELSHFSMLRSELMNKDPDVVPEQTPLIISNSKSAVCKDNNRKDTKQTRHISRVMHFGGNGEK